MRFNQPVPSTKTTNLAGGVAYSLSEEYELATMALTFLGDSQYYQTATNKLNRIVELARNCSPEFVASLALYVRNVHGLRTSSHVLAAALAKNLSRKPWATEFFRRVIFRPDDMAEIISFFLLLGGKSTLTNAMKKGFKKVLESASLYSLAKYKMEGKTVNLVDIVRLCHPKNTEAINALVYDRLKQHDTWEDRLSSGEDKTETWRSLLKEGKLGYFACLRNLRNILATGDEEIVQMAIALITDPAQVKQCKILPAQFLKAYQELSRFHTENPKQVRNILKAIDTAITMSLDNFPALEGDTLIALDTSGSMSNVIDTAALFASCCYLKYPSSTLLMFSDEAKVANCVGHSPLSILQQIKGQMRMSDTNFSSIIPYVLKIKPKRVIIVSDMQSWMEGRYQIEGSFRQQWNIVKGDARLYSIDVTGYGTIQVPQANTFLLSGISNETLRILPEFEEDPNALLTDIMDYGKGVLHHA